MGFGGKSRRDRFSLRPRLPERVSWFQTPQYHKPAIFALVQHISAAKCRQVLRQRNPHLRLFPPIEQDAAEILRRDADHDKFLPVQVDRPSDQPFVTAIPLLPCAMADYSDCPVQMIIIG